MMSPWHATCATAIGKLKSWSMLAMGVPARNVPFRWSHHTGTVANHEKRNRLPKHTNSVRNHSRTLK